MTNETTVKTPQERIVDLKALKATKWAEMVKLDGDSEEAVTANLELYKISQQIKSAEAEIVTAERQLEVANKRNERIKLFDDVIVAHAHHLKTAASKATADEKRAAHDDFIAKSEIVKNELLAKYATVSAPRAAGTGEPKGAKGAAIIAMYEANKATGMDVTANIKAIIASGHSRGTTGAVVLAHRKAIGEVAIGE